jgi:drug/metabolite transporter (DMT)-like permease
MLLLLLSALCSATLMLVFKAFEKWGVNVWQGVTFNYIVCVITGSIVFITKVYSPESASSGSLEWLYPSGILGILFFTGFSLSGFSTQKAGVTITTLAAKMSLIMPVLFNVLFVPGNNLSLLAYTGIALTFPALWLASAKKEDKGSKNLQQAGIAGILFPVLVFISGGIVDTTINWSNGGLKGEQQQALFSIASFGAAAVAGIIVLIFRMIRTGERIHWRSLAGGVALGVPNYFSIYLLLQALSAFDNNGAWLFPLYNILIILTASAASVWLFREKLTRTNLIGMALAMVALTLLAA